ncbi:hypothetical protein HK104_007503, partial [Borealophlyctis nickersoniae]
GESHVEEDGFSLVDVEGDSNLGVDVVEDLIEDVINVAAIEGGFPNDLADLLVFFEEAVEVEVGSLYGEVGAHGESVELFEGLVGNFEVGVEEDEFCEVYVVLTEVSVGEVFEEELVVDVGVEGFDVDCYEGVCFGGIEPEVFYVRDDVDGFGDDVWAVVGKSSNLGLDLL